MRASAEQVAADWLRSVLFDRGYLARIKGDTIKVYLVVLQACNGEPDRSVTLSLRQLMERTKLSCPTILESMDRLESLGLVVSTTRQRGRVRTYYVADPPSTAA
jgi:replication initiation and membrane attachment protein DnaB